jgi:uncharacterized protein
MDTRPSLKHVCVDLTYASVARLLATYLAFKRKMGEKTMGTYLSQRELSGLTAPDNTTFPSPVPLQMISNGEFNPLPQTEQQRKVEGRLKELADQHGRKLGLDRRRFLRSTCGMAAAFMALNDIFGRVFDVDPAEAKEPEMGAARAASLSKQFVFDDQLHFVRDDYD